MSDSWWQSPHLRVSLCVRHWRLSPCTASLLKKPWRVWPASLLIYSPPPALFWLSPDGSPTHRNALPPASSRYWRHRFSPFWDSFASNPMFLLLWLVGGRTRSHLRKASSL